MYIYYLHANTIQNNKQILVLFQLFKDYCLNSDNS